MRYVESNPKLDWFAPHGASELKWMFIHLRISTHWFAPHGASELKFHMIILLVRSLRFAPHGASELKLPVAKLRDYFTSGSPHTGRVG